MIRLICALTFLAAAAGAMAGGEAEPPTIPDRAFAIAGSDLLYSLDTELRWHYDAATGDLRLQTTNDVYWDVEVIGDNVLRLSHPRQRRDFYWFRIGSPEYKRMQEYRECVTDNRGRKLFELENCGDLPPGIE